MGNSLSTRFEWSEVAVGGKAPLTKDGLPLLQTSVTNQDILYDIVNMIEQLAHSFPMESKAEFRTPLVWNTHLLPLHFSSHATSGLWIVKEAAKSHKSTVSSITVRPDGQPVFHMEQTDSGYKAKVASFEYLEKFLQVLGSCLKEIANLIKRLRMSKNYPSFNP
jgi:hypothetical protein